MKINIEGVQLFLLVIGCACVIVNFKVKPKKKLSIKLIKMQVKPLKH